MSGEKDYVLGTHDDEIERLGLQHRVWRPRALDAWRRAGFTVGQTLLDVGCGPGHASVDLGRISLDRAQTILQALAERQAAPHTLMVTPAVLEIIAVRP